MWAHTHTHKHAHAPTRAHLQNTVPTAIIIPPGPSNPPRPHTHAFTCSKENQRRLHLRRRLNLCLIWSQVSRPPFSKAWITVHFMCVCVCVRSIPGYRRLSPTLLQGLGSGERTEKRNEQLLTTTCKSISASGRKRGNGERKQGWGERCGGSEQQRDEKLVTSSDRVRNWVGGGNVAWHYKWQIRNQRDKDKDRESSKKKKLNVQTAEKIETQRKIGIDGLWFFFFLLSFLLP